MPAPHTAPPTRRSLQTPDIDVLAACLHGWGQHYDQLTSGAFAGEFEEFGFSAVQIFREVMNQSVFESGAPQVGAHTVAVAAGLDGDGWFNGQTVYEDSLLLVRDGEGFDFRTPRRHEVMAAVVDDARLAVYARQVEHREIDFSRRAPIETAPARAGAFRNFLSTLFASLRAAPTMLESPQLRRALEQAIYAAVLEAMGEVEEDFQLPPNARARQAIVERARECVRAHPDEPPTVADLCALLGVSRRTLQYCFQEVLDLNPVRFLRVMRLNGVRRDLREAAARGETIGDIAARWGFWHLSHFAADYREMFGELPSETLKKA
jgi:AraC family ethanolamine operon transcriptional activator